MALIDTLPALSASPAVVDLPAVDALDARAVLALRGPVTDAVADGPAVVLLDLSRVGTVTPSGVAGLLDLLRAARSRGGDLRVHGMPLAVRRAYRPLRLDTLVRLHVSRDAALVGVVRAA